MIKCVRCIRGMEYGNYSNVFLGTEGSINFTFRQEKANVKNFSRELNLLDSMFIAV